jgi:prephenate dehydrogenase
MGGSLALAWRQAVGGTVRGYSPDRAEAEEARRAGAVDHVCETVAESATEVDWWIIATPLGALAQVWAAVDSVGPGRVMDLASLQGPALRAAGQAGAAGRSVSAHPMVGREGSGFRAADPLLYDGAPIWLSASDQASDSLRAEAESFWQGVGAQPAWIDAATHDERMVGASHLPQLTANALARTLAARGLTPSDLGPGGRDMTRLAASSPAMWRDLLGESAPRVASALKSLNDEIGDLIRMLDAGDVEGLSERMSETRKWRTPR